MKREETSAITALKELMALEVERVIQEKEQKRKTRFNNNNNRFNFRTYKRYRSVLNKKTQELEIKANELSKKQEELNNIKTKPETTNINPQVEISKRISILPAIIISIFIIGLLAITMFFSIRERTILIEQQENQIENYKEKLDIYKQKLNESELQIQVYNQICNKEKIIPEENNTIIIKTIKTKPKINKKTTKNKSNKNRSKNKKIKKETETEPKIVPVPVENNSSKLDNDPLGEFEL